MVAVLAFIHSAGGCDASAIARPTQRVVSTRDAIISRRLRWWYAPEPGRPVRCLLGSRFSWLRHDFHKFHDGAPHRAHQWEPGKLDQADNDIETSFEQGGGP